ncbi:hypothetical protein AAMO2058_000327500 [Amorphochlora amoebiformis]
MGCKQSRPIWNSVGEWYLSELYERPDLGDGKKFSKEQFWKSRNDYTDEQKNRFLGDEIFMHLTKRPTISLFKAAKLSQTFSPERRIRQITFPNPDNSFADPFIILGESLPPTLLFSDTKARKILATRIDVETGLESVSDRGNNYPSVVVHKGKVFSVGPCEKGGKGLALFVAEEFPKKWRVVTIIDKKAGVMHPTIVSHNGRMYIFNTRRRYNSKGQHRLGLYTKEAKMDLYVGPLHGDDNINWSLHPNSPIVVSPQSALSGGAFINHDGRLYRMAMDCSIYYGLAVRPQLVCKLSPTEYEEKEAPEIVPFIRASGGEEFNALGMHVATVMSVNTGNQDGWIGVVCGFGAPSKGWSL